MENIAHSFYLIWDLKDGVYDADDECEKNYPNLLYIWKSIAFEYPLAHRWYENVNGCRYLAVEKQARESKSSTIASYSNESVDDQKPLDCPINEESTSTFVYSIAEDGGNECEKPFQPLAEFKTHHETTHESISNEENVSPSGAALI